MIESQDTLLFLRRIALIIDDLPNDVKVSVQGHTDNQPPGAKSSYKDNWELSSARAISVLQELLLDGVESQRIHASGYGEFTPVATNATKSGQEKNNRVELHFYGQEAAKKKNVKTSVLDKAAFK